MTASSASDASSPTMRKDLASAYLASATRFAGSVIISALVFRFVGIAEFAMFALVRGTIGLLNYTSLGLAPALIRHGAQAERQPRPVLPAAVPESPGEKTLSYYAGPPKPIVTFSHVHSTAVVIAYGTLLLGLVVTLIYAGLFNAIYRVPPELQSVMPMVVLFIGAGLLVRLVGDAAGAVLQVRQRISLDNALLAGGDIIWVVLSTGVVLIPGPTPAVKLGLVGFASLIASYVMLQGRSKSAQREAGAASWRLFDSGVAKALLGYGLLVVAAQLADYLYAPTDYILIDRLLSPTDVAFYAPAVQIDSGLLLLVTGLSAVMLPKAALAHAAGSARTVRAYYVRGTLASLALLAVASVCVWAAAPWILRIWLGNPMPGTQAILPLVLIGTTLGGASAVGRSILLAVGKAKPFAISVLIAGIVNAACSYVFVRYFHRGLQGILLGTVVAVVGRCVLWMPWYVLQTLRSHELANLPDDLVPPIL